ncbi:hypothetical protein DHEL01_v202883 [Diaporthe helianthi]|uniref:Uncharacterized protein n=1 Tax=Diaporthe helianthi TaxID=158607 RepID=A0A2P5I887_DIAHE|nr:hypothetical protein DHEL01_v202883 [Diaporthe helianthi]
MYRAVWLTLAAMAIFAIAAAMAPPVNTTQILSALGSAITSAADRSHTIYRRTLTSIPFDDSFIDQAQVLVIEHLHTVQHSAKEVLIPYIDAGRHFVTQAMKQHHHFFCSVGEPHPPRPSIESITYRPQPGPYPQYGSHPQYDLYAWDIPHSSCGPRQDPFENPSTQLIVLATSVITAMILITISSVISISSAILATMRFPWRCAKALVARLSSKPKKKAPRRHPVDAETRSTHWKIWEIICEKLGHSLLNLVESLFALVAIFSTGLLFCIGSFVVFAHNVNIRLKFRVPPPAPPPPPQVDIRYIADAEVPKLKRDIWRLNQEATDNNEEKAEHLTIIHNLKYQVKEEKKRSSGLKKERDGIIKEKKASDARSARQLEDEKTASRKLKSSLWAEQVKHAALQKSHASCQDKLNEAKMVHEHCIDQKVALEKDLKAVRAQRDELLTSQKEDKEALNKEALDKEALKKELQQRDEHLASQEKDKEALKKGLQERDETIKANEKTIQDLQAQLKNKEERHASQRKSESTHIKRAFEREMNKMKKAFQQKSADHKTAEAKLKAMTEAHEAAEKKLEAENATRKQAEAALEAESKDRKAADSHVSKLKTEVALLKLKLSNGRPVYVDQGTETSVPSNVPPPHLREKLPAKAPRPSGAKNEGPVPPPMFKMPSTFNFGASTAAGIFGADPSH